ncbi:unnamed protein product [Effrenium voratum]|uniref:Uncharacterized protein n=1 Tax=Effrenium voratum TaxID=2562239 RepID=A0AA36HMC2_9DINO|nr:unnamed protein product [Effrenium voratum]CAJ1436469.1 unnamed protein product [Effrenium voratum]
MHLCAHCSFNGERGLCERIGGHHAPYCPRFRATCKFCNCVGSYDCIMKEHGLHENFCPRFRGQCKFCGIIGSYEQVADVSPFHKWFCERASPRCRCGAELAVPGGHHKVTCSLFRGECKHCQLVGPSWYVTTAGPQHDEECPRRWSSFEPARAIHFSPL